MVFLIRDKLCIYFFLVQNFDLFFVFESKIWPLDTTKSQNYSSTKRPFFVGGWLTRQRPTWLKASFCMGVSEFSQIIYIFHINHKTTIWTNANALFMVQNAMCFELAFEYCSKILLSTSSFHILDRAIYMVMDATYAPILLILFLLTFTCSTIQWEIKFFFSIPSWQINTMNIWSIFDVSNLIVFA